MSRLNDEAKPFVDRKGYHRILSVEQESLCIQSYKTFSIKEKKQKDAGCDGRKAEVFMGVLFFFGALT